MLPSFSIQYSVVRASKSRSLVSTLRIEFDPFPDTQITPGSTRLANTLWIDQLGGRPLTSRRGPRLSSYWM